MLTVCRYVERNPLRAKLAERAEEWPWSSLWPRGHPEQGTIQPGLWVARPTDWVPWVNSPDSPAELEGLRDSVSRGRP